MNYIICYSYTLSFHIIKVPCGCRSQVENWHTCSDSTAVRPASNPCSLEPVYSQGPYNRLRNVLNASPAPSCTTTPPSSNTLLNTYGAVSCATSGIPNRVPNTSGAASCITAGVPNKIFNTPGAPICAAPASTSTVLSAQCAPCSVPPASSNTILNAPCAASFNSQSKTIVTSTMIGPAATGGSGLCSNNTTTGFQPLSVSNYATSNNMMTSSSPAAQFVLETGIAH